ncbi:Lrp/AsnC family transcriptional regulator [Haladaptatus salinisoli]|uniref:Lrp/AsnC family transcriptional regulator n=1 Tax=Haladaptatus salinisoli TaxID=2884876 RepID=UPI001D0ADF45|nr:winged helix-turn-helix transcriptional regulator [Haladaptatus salinisoli]
MRRRRTQITGGRRSYSTRVQRVGRRNGGILRILREDARQTTAQEIADTVGVSASTVRNRIDQLEAEGIVRGYHPKSITKRRTSRSE